MRSFAAKVNGTSKGFSIVQVLVAGAIASVLMVAFGQYLNSAMKGQKSVQNAVDFDILKTSINMVLNTKACDGAFKSNASGDNVQLSFPATLPLGTNIIAATSPIAIDNIRQGNTVLATLGLNLGAGMTISSLAFTDAIFDGDQVIGANTYKAFVATLNIGAQKAAHSYGAPGYSANFSVRLLVNPSTSLVERCGTAGAKSIVQKVWTNAWAFTAGTTGTTWYPLDVVENISITGDKVLLSAALVYRGTTGSGLGSNPIRINRDNGAEYINLGSCPVAGTGYPPGYPTLCSPHYLFTGLSAGNHKFQLEYQVQGYLGMSCDPTSNPGKDYRSLLLQEL